MLPERGYLWCMNRLQPYCATILGGEMFRDLCMSAVRYYNAADSDVYLENPMPIDLPPWQVIELLQVCQPFFDVTGLSLDFNEPDLVLLNRPSKIMTLVACAVGTHLRDGTMPAQAGSRGLAIFQMAFALLPTCLFGHPNLANVKAGVFVLAYLMRANRVPAVISLCGSLRRLMESQGMHKSAKTLPPEVIRDRQSTARAVFIVDQQISWNAGTPAMRAGHDVSVTIFEGKNFTNALDLRLARVGADLSAEDHRYSCSRYMARIADAVGTEELPLGIEMKQLFLRMSVFSAKLILDTEGPRPVWTTDSGSHDEAMRCAEETVNCARQILRQSGIVRGDLTAQILYGSDFPVVIVASTILFVNTLVTSERADAQLLRQVCEAALAQPAVASAATLRVGFSFCLQCAEVAELALEHERSKRQASISVPTPSAASSTADQQPYRDA